MYVCVCVCVCVCMLRSHCVGYVSVYVFVLRSHWDVCVMDLILIQMRPKGPTGSAPVGHAASLGQQRLPGCCVEGEPSLEWAEPSHPALPAHLITTAKAKGKRQNSVSVWRAQKTV